MKKIGFRIIILILFLLVFNYILIINNDKNNIKKYFEKEATSNITSIVNNQYDINKKLNSIVDDDNYTISNPYIELNPYKISPLSAIIIFNTSGVTMSASMASITKTAINSINVKAFFLFINHFSYLPFITFLLILSKKFRMSRG